MKRKSIVLAALISSGLAAASVAYAAQWSDPFYIEDLRAYNGDSVYRVAPAADVFNPAGCPNKTYYQELPGIDAETAQMMNKALMAAMLGGKSVKLSVATGSCSSEGHPAFFRVIVQK